MSIVHPSGTIRLTENQINVHPYPSDANPNLSSPALLGPRFTHSQTEPPDAPNQEGPHEPIDDTPAADSVDAGDDDASERGVLDLVQDGIAYVRVGDEAIKANDGVEWGQVQQF